MSPRRFDMNKKQARTTLRGYDVLRDPLLNKGSAFTDADRDRLGLHGLLPPRVASLEEQLVRVGGNYDLLTDDLSRYVYLRSLQDRNETLFYAFALSRLEEIAPVVYTPTVGAAVQRFSHIFQRPRGLFLHPDNIDRLPDMIDRLPAGRGVRLIVATDSQGILGIGDQGMGGMGIPIGKLALYTLGAGIHPAACLPVVLDVGTDNRELLDDPLYLGWRHERLEGEPYFDFVGRFVIGMQKALPGALLQWEDFSKQNAFTLLDAYRSERLSFNDDIQGTGAVVLGGVLAALKATGRRFEDERIVVFGAGAGGVGVARQLRAGLVRVGLDPDAARRRIYMLDSRGVILSDRPHLEPYKSEFARNPSDVADWELETDDAITLLDTVKNAKPTVLIGTSGQAGAFDKRIVRTMMKAVSAPLIFPLSNPTSKTEAQPADLFEWTEGRAVVATGSPFPPVSYGGREYPVGQGNNVFVFPGIGLGALISGASEVTDEMLTAAAFALYESVSDGALAERRVYPRISELREVTAQIAAAVATEAARGGVAEPIEGDVESFARARMWSPEYFELIAG